MLRVHGKEAPWQGKVLREAQFAFVMFVGDGGGDLKPRVVQPVYGVRPSAVVIELEPAGIVRHRETGKDVRLTHPGIMLSFCEKSGAITTSQEIAFARFPSPTEGAAALAVGPRRCAPR